MHLRQLNARPMGVPNLFLLGLAGTTLVYDKWKEYSIVSIDVPVSTGLQETAEHYTSTPETIY